MSTRRIRFVMTDSVAQRSLTDLLVEAGFTYHHRPRGGYYLPTNTGSWDTMRALYNNAYPTRTVVLATKQMTDDCVLRADHRRNPIVLFDSAVVAARFPILQRCGTWIAPGRIEWILHKGVSVLDIIAVMGRAIQTGDDERLVDICDELITIAGRFAIQFDDMLTGAPDRAALVAYLLGK